MSEEYCIYLRKSRADENVPNTNLEEILSRHEKALTELGKSMNLNITKIYREVVSGDTIASRPVVQELLADVEAGAWAGVLVMEIERLARGDTIDQGIISQTFKYSNTKIITPLKTYNTNDEFDEEYFEFGLFMSRREYKAINRRLQRGRIASVKEGKFLGSIPPYGYDRVYDKNIKGYTLKFNKSEVDIVRLIFELYTKGQTNQYELTKRLEIPEICSALQKLGIHPRKANTWSVSTIREILTNPVYIGKIRWNSRKTVNTISNGAVTKTRPRNKPENWILVDGLHPPVISKETFDAAQYYINQNKTNPSNIVRNITNPLAGLIICSECSRKMVARKYKNNTPTGLICTTRNCKNIGSALRLVEDRVIETLEKWLNGYELNLSTEISAANIEIQKKRLNQINHGLENIKVQTDNIYNLLEQGVYTTEIFHERMETISLQKSKLIDEKKNILNNSTYNADNIKNNSLSNNEGIINVYRRLNDPQIKNKILKEIAEKIFYTKHKKGTHRNPDNFEITIYPKLKKYK